MNVSMMSVLDVIKDHNSTILYASPPPHHQQQQHEPCQLTQKTIFYMTMYSLVILLVFAGNIYILTTLLSLRKNRDRYRNIDLFLAYLASFDLLATLMITVDVYENLTCFVEWPFGLFTCKIVYPCYHISLSMTVCILGLMSIDRCRSITRPLKEKFSKRSIHQAVLISFLLSVGIQWYQFYYLGITPSGICNTDKTKLEFAVPRLFAIFVRDIVFLVTFTVTTVLVYRSIKKQEKKIRQFYSKSKQGSHSVMSMLIVMELAFILLVMPYDVYDCAMLLSRILPGAHPIKTSPTIRDLDRVLSILQMSNSFANCFIYAKMHKKLNRHRLSYGSCNAKSRTLAVSMSYTSSNNNGKFRSETRICTDFETISPKSSTSSCASNRRRSSTRCIINQDSRV